IPLCITNLLDGKPLPVYGDGRNIRDWLYVEDHCRGIERVLEAGRPGENYNIGGVNEWANIDIVELLCTLADEAFAAEPALALHFPAAPPARGEPSRRLVRFVTDRPGHDRRYAIDATKIQHELGFAPRERFETGIRKTLRWYLDNEPWWRAIQDGSYRQTP
ncbi:MAG: dTDP-glucose 4,6-dehydratase, partial [Gammaproteobacteria bacterium]